MTVESQQAPRVVVVAGPPCAGKSTVARQLSVALTTPHLEVDQFRARILPQSDQRLADRDIAYNAMHFAAELIVRWSHSVILDATYTAKACRRGLLDVVEHVGGSLFVIECHVSTAAAVERFGGRGVHPALDLTPTRVASLATDYPYWPAAVDIQTDSGSVDFNSILESLRGRPLDNAARIAWRERGSACQRSVVTKSLL